MIVPEPKTADNEAVNQTSGEMKMKKESKSKKGLMFLLKLSYYAILFMFG